MDDNLPKSPPPLSESSSLPPPITIKEETKYSEKKDPPMLFILFTNPVTYFKKWVEKFLKNQDIDFHLRIRPFAAIGLIMTISIVGGGAFTIGRYFFPYSSPVFHRQVVYPGTIQKGDKNQFFLMTQDATPWKLKPKTSINLENLIGRQVVVTGNLTAEKYLIEVSELIIAETPTQSLTYAQNTPTYQTPNIPPTPSSTSSADLPKLYSSLSWEITQTKTLIFTSGKRKIEEEGIYLESAQVADFPQDFINYYINALKANGFKQTLNSINPDGITVTFAKDDLFLTFGVKNVYKGSGEKKQLAGFKAYIEHN